MEKGFVAADAHDVCVAGQRVEGGETVGLDEGHGVILAEPGEDVGERGHGGVGAGDRRSCGPGLLAGSWRSWKNSLRGEGGRERSHHHFDHVIDVAVAEGFEINAVLF